MSKPQTIIRDPAENLREIRNRIATAAESAGRKADDICLVAVTKRQPEDKVEALLRAGQRVFGENRLQEAQDRWTDRRQAYADLELHMVGPLQTNKVEETVALFDAVHSLDRPKLAKKFADEMSKHGRCPDLFIQVNTGEEEQKSGVLPQDLDAFVTLCLNQLALPVVGLMCLPPQFEEPALHFALLQKFAKQYGLEKLSMGMSRDFETAIEFGATHLRLGTVLLGPRET